MWNSQNIYYFSLNMTHFHLFLFQMFSFFLFYTLHMTIYFQIWYFFLKDGFYQFNWSVSKYYVWQMGGLPISDFFWRGGRCVWIPPFLTDIICEKPKTTLTVVESGSPRLCITKSGFKNNHTSYRGDSVWYLIPAQCMSSETQA